MATIMKRDQRNSDYQKSREEWMIGSESELDDITTAGPGSIAYTANMMHIYQMDEGGSWQEIGLEEGT